MPKYFLRVEAVNLSNFVYDTHDISTIRGGSFLLLEAIEGLAGEFQNELDCVTTAASQGLFRYEAPEEDPEGAIRDLQSRVFQYLHGRTGGHATLVLAVEPDIPNNFPLVMERLEAGVYRQHWRLPTVAVPEPVSAKKACHLDGWRPGVVSYPYAEDEYISAATSFRREQGIPLKRRLFHRLLGEERYQRINSTQDLEELSLRSGQGVLDGKIAYIYVDGNGFGKIRRELCRTPTDRSNFDKTIQDGFRKPFLKALLEKAEADPSFQTNAGDNGQGKALRLEVLLWGGDEMTLVVPAWQGLAVLDLFFELGKKLDFNRRPLTHRAAVIFCHHNAPILLIRQIAESLLARTKQDIRAALSAGGAGEVLEHSDGDALHYLVLESFELLQGDLDSFLQEYYRGIDYRDLLLRAGELDTLVEALRTIRANVAKSKALEIVYALQQGQRDKLDPLTNQILRLVPRENREPVAGAVQTLTQAGPARWFLATDLWDYIPERAAP